MNAGINRRMKTYVATARNSSHRPSGQGFLVDQLYIRQPGIPATLGLIGVNIIVFIAMVVSGAGLWHSSTEVQLVWGANFGPATQDGQSWRLGSALFVHFGLVHLAMNMLALWDAGRLVERMYGSARFLLLYFLSGLGGNLQSLVLHRGEVVSGGASGAIFGIYGALLVCLWDKRNQLQRREFRWLFWGGACFFILLFTVGQMLPIIDNAAHLGGLAAGVIAGVMLMRPLDRDAEDTSLPTRFSAAFVLAIAISILMLNIPAPRYRWSEELNARKEIARLLREDAEIRGVWQTLLSAQSHEREYSFDQLAGRIESGVANRYEDSFEQLSRINVGAAAPSASALAALREYLASRRDASRDMAKGLRARNDKTINGRLDTAKGSGKIVPPDGAYERNVPNPPEPEKAVKP
jgi:rhomboid protease GluP